MPIRKIALYLLVGIGVTLLCQCVLLLIQQRSLAAAAAMGPVASQSPLPFLADLPVVGLVGTDVFATRDGPRYWRLDLREAPGFSGVYGERTAAPSMPAALLSMLGNPALLQRPFNILAEVAPGTMLLPKSKSFPPQRWTIAKAPDLTDQLGLPVERLYIVEVGWPWRLTGGEHHRRTSSPGDVPICPGMVSGERIGFPPVPGLPLVGWIPLRPIWPNILLTVALWSAVAAIIIETPIALRKRHRRKKGRCPTCGYSRAGLASTLPCPECGHRAAIS